MNRPRTTSSERKPATPARPRPTPREEPAIRVLLVDDHAVLRAGLQLVLDGEEASDGRRFEVVAEADSGPAALASYERVQPDVVVTDLRMPEMRGDELARRLVRRWPGAKVLVLSTYDAEEEIAGCFDAGVLGYALKETPADRLVEAVAAVAAGRRWLCPQASSRLAERMSHESLTGREIEVLELAATGLANKQIAAELGCAAGTVKIHMGRIFQKLRVESRTEAVRVAQQRGWVREGRG